MWGKKLLKWGKKLVTKWQPNLTSIENLIDRVYRGIEDFIDLRKNDPIENQYTSFLPHSFEKFFTPHIHRKSFESLKIRKENVCIGKDDGVSWHRLTMKISVFTILIGILRLSQEKILLGKMTLDDFKKLYTTFFRFKSSQIFSGWSLIYFKRNKNLCRANFDWFKIFDSLISVFENRNLIENFSKFISIFNYKSFLLSFFVNIFLFSSWFL